MRKKIVETVETENGFQEVEETEEAEKIHPLGFEHDLDFAKSISNINKVLDYLNYDFNKYKYKNEYH